MNTHQITLLIEVIGRINTPGLFETMEEFILSLDENIQEQVHPAMERASKRALTRPTAFTA